MTTGTASEILQRLDKIEILLAGQQPQPLSFPEACAYLHLGKGTLYRMTSKAEIVHYKTGKKIFFLKADLDAWLTRNRVSTRTEG